MTKAAAVLAFLIIFYGLGRMFPVVRFTGYGRVVKNMGLAAINALLSPLIVIPIAALAVRYALHWRPDWWSGTPGLLVDLLLLDIWIYWWHRANHVVPFLWRFHEVHHLDETLDATSALRFHFGEVLLSSLVRALVIFLLAVPLANVLIFETLLAGATMFHHSNIRMPARLERLLAYFVVTPSIHWVHHHAIRSDTDSNYATVLSLWDKLFSSRSRTQRTAEMPVGVEGRSDTDFMSLVVRPFSNIRE